MIYNQPTHNKMTPEEILAKHLKECHETHGTTVPIEYHGYILRAMKEHASQPHATGGEGKIWFPTTEQFMIAFREFRMQHGNFPDVTGFYDWLNKNTHIK